MNFRSSLVSVVCWVDKVSFGLLATKFPLHHGSAKDKLKLLFVRSTDRPADSGRVEGEIN